MALDDVYATAAIAIDSANVAARPPINIILMQKPKFY